MLRRRTIGDAGNRIALQNLGQDRGASRIDWDKETQLPRNDLAEQAVGAQPIPHRVGESGQLDPVHTHYADAPDLKALGEIKYGLAIDQRGKRGVWGKTRCSGYQ